MKKSDLVSVIIPVYNVEKYLEQCLKSVISQTYENIEILLIDDGSTDNSGTICDNYGKKDNRITVIHQKNKGLSGARNAGIQQSMGKYLTFIDSDDWVDKNYVEELYDNARKTKADIVITSHKIHYPKKTIDLATEEVGILRAEQALKRILYSKNLDLSTWAKLYKKELFDNVRFPEDRLYEDSATTYKLIDLSNIISVKSISTYNYRMNSSSISKCDFNPKKLDLITSTREMCNFVTEKYPKLKFAAKRRLEYARLSTLAQLAKSKSSYAEIETSLMKEIKDGRLTTILNINTPIRDKMGLIATLGGYKTYKKMWLAYEKLTKREMS